MRKKGKAKREGREGCAALRLGRDDGGLSVSAQARRLREALGRVRETRRRGGGEQCEGDERWQVAAMRAIREGESSASSPGPGEDDWESAGRSTNPTNGGCSGNAGSAQPVLREDHKEIGEEGEEVLDAEFC